MDVSLDAAIKTVVRALHWSPKEIENLYHDDADFFGLFYWYEDVRSHIGEIKNSENNKD